MRSRGTEREWQLVREREREAEAGEEGGKRRCSWKWEENRAVEGINVPHAIYGTLNYLTAGCRRQLLRWRGEWRREEEAVALVSTAECWWRTLCCNANLLSCLSSAANCRGQKHKRQEMEKQTDGAREWDSNRMEMSHRKERKNKGIEEMRKNKDRRKEKRGKDALNRWQKKQEKINNANWREKEKKRG